MDRQTITVERPGKFLYDMRQRPIVPGLVRDPASGWFKSQMPLEFDATGDGDFAPVGSVVEQWLSKIRGALREPDSRVLLVGLMKKNIDPDGSLGLADHPRVILWESQGKSDNKRAAGVIPSRVTVVLALRFIRHSLLDAVKAQAEQRNIVFLPLVSPADTRKFVRIGLMSAEELERRLRPAMASPLRSLMDYASPQAVASTQTLIHGQIHKLVQGDDIPAPLEPVPVLPPIFDSNGVIVKKTIEAPEAPVKKKRVIVNKAIGPVQRVLMQNTEVALDRTLNYSERARRLIGKCREAGLNKTSEPSLALAIKAFEVADDAAKAKAAQALITVAPAPVVAVTPVESTSPVEVTAPTPAPPPPPQRDGAIGKILSLIEQQQNELKLAEEHVQLARIAQSEIADHVKSAIEEARGEARRALEQTLASMRLA